MYRLTSILLAGAVVFGIGAKSAYAQVGLGLAPMRAELKMAPGAVYSGALDLTNEATVKVRVRTELLDFYIDRESTPQFNREIPTEANSSCRKWLTVNPMEGEVNAEGHLLARYTIRVPAGVAPKSYNCAVGFTTLPAVDGESGIGMRSAVRVVCAFYVVVGNPPMDGQVTGLSLEFVPLPTKSWRAVVTVANNGDMYFRPEGKLDLLDESGKAVETLDVSPLPVLPRREQRFVIPLTRVDSGRTYTMRTRLDLGTHEIQEAAAEIRAIEPPQK